MKTFSFKVGTSLKIDSQMFKIERMLEDSQVQLESLTDGTLIRTSIEELLKGYADKRIIFVEKLSEKQIPELPLNRSISTFAEPIQANAIRKKRYLDFILGMGPFVSTKDILDQQISEFAKSINDVNPPSSISVYRWHRELLRHHGDYRALIDRHDRKGGLGSRLHPGTCTVVQDVIDEIYLSEQRNSGETVFYEVVYRINKLNEFLDEREKLPVPSKSTINRAIASLDHYEKTAARFGARYAQMKYRTSGQGIRATRILECVEIDHTPLDLFIIDDVTGLPSGRPTVTVAIDKYSKMLVGLHVGFSGPSLEAVFACLRHALTPKTYIKESYPEIEGDWPCHGHIETLVCDNGLEFHSKELERVALEVGVSMQYCPKRQAYYKGSVERFLKTLNYQFSREIPGHSFPKWFHREDYDPQKHALVTFDKLMRLLHKWIVDIYARQLHRGINTSPYKKWQDGAKSVPPKLLTDLNRLDVSLGRTCERVIWHYGIELHNIRYNDNALLVLRRQHGEKKKFQVRFYFDDISVIHVIDPLTKQTIAVPALAQDYARGLTMEQHRLIGIRARDTNAGVIDITSLARAKHEIRQFIDELSIDKSQRIRQRSARIKAIKQKKQPNFLDDSIAKENVRRAPPPPSAHIENDELPDFGSAVFTRRSKTKGSQS
ncbi:hypothetical protein DBR37_03255 [Herminiimonas sp. KBW02]|uniref:integrase catalytic domain-containing protein n=1 Tax=Herminiimonas sp. KBW02 TaxID=2153363 RepID=UPI000F59EF3D|nr:Mu transposase C-terminal domain-containing protein [Herminiimonas sp. KBW02]RQO37220.1 hypothetical protein DBR37_03255 [Herminiimonas sp. KBW02]